MEVYKFKDLDNGDILLEKIILDNTNYIIINKGNGDILLKKIETITNIDDIKKYDFRKSNILSCSINYIRVPKLKYKSILKNIYEIINNGAKITKKSKLNIKTIEEHDEGFYYLEKLGISIQGVDANKCLLEIVNQSIENKITINIKIKLNDGTNVNISF
jgi:hypothetical protein